MNKKVYIVFIHTAYDESEYGGYEEEVYMDSIWEDDGGAKIRLDILSNELIEKYWYEDGSIPGKDYKAEWTNDKRSVKYRVDPYTEYTIYIEEHELRSGWNEDYEDLPAYFTTT